MSHTVYQSHLSLLHGRVANSFGLSVLPAWHPQVKLPAKVRPNKIIFYDHPVGIAGLMNSTRDSMIIASESGLIPSFFLSQGYFPVRTYKESLSPFLFAVVIAYFSIKAVPRASS